MPRGRGRGRGGRRGSRSRSVRTSGNTEPKECARTDIDIESHPKDFFLGVATTEQHLKAQEKNRSRYAAVLAVLQKNGVAISQNSRIRALAMAWGRKDYGLANTLLKNREEFGLVEVLKALTLLDSGRQLRVLEKRLKQLQLSPTKVKPRKLGKIKSDINSLTVLALPGYSANSSVIKEVKNWVQTFSKEELEFYALHLPKEPWKKLADICHFNPKLDFHDLPWFLPFCFGADAPEGSMVHRCRDITQDNVNSLVQEFEIPYSHLKELKDSLTEESKGRIAKYEKLDTILWYYEDLQCTTVDNIVENRLDGEEAIKLPSGKLLERLLTFKMIRENIRAGDYHEETPAQSTNDKVSFLTKLVCLAEPRLTSIRLPLEAPIVVIGDASGSMEVAIRTSTIIASLLTAITSARLVFFNTENRDAPFLPKTVDEVLKLAVTTRADGGTAPAASLWPFYEHKEVVKTFIIVTDEEENTSYKNYYFSELYKLYCNEIYPARLVFVSFLCHQHAEGTMVRALNSIGHTPLQFRLEGSRPDLSKLDHLFGLLSSESSTFDDELSATEKLINAEGLATVFDSLHRELAAKV